MRMRISYLITVSDGCIKLDEKIYNMLKKLIVLWCIINNKKEKIYSNNKSQTRVRV